MDAHRSRSVTVLYWSALLGVIAAGALFRSWGVLVGTVDFWADEAWWATNIRFRSFAEFGIRPVGYMWLAQHLIPFEPQELVLRLPSYLPGVGVVICAYFTAKRLFANRLLVLLAVTIIAFHPRLIVFSKEFKPYSFETFIHSGLILWALVYMQSRRATIPYLTAIFAAVPFCYNALFLYPGLLFRQWTALARRMDVLRWLAVAVVALGVVTVLQGPFYDALDMGARREFWARKYDVFPLGLGFFDCVAWYAEKTWAILTMPMAFAGAPAGHLFGIAYLAGLAAMVMQRRYAEFWLLAGPLAMTALANMLGFWPYGAFRTNLFLLPPTVLVACWGLEWAWSHDRTRILAYVSVVAALLAAVPWDPSYFKTKHRQDGAPAPQLTAVLDDVQSRYRADSSPVTNVILADWHSWRSIHYYLNYSPRGRDTYADIRENSILVRGPLNDPVELTGRLAGIRDDALAGDGPTRVWLVVTKLDRFEGVLSHPLVIGHRHHQNRFAVHDPIYHPELVELHFHVEPGP